jgi:hypothetical protein
MLATGRGEVLTRLADMPETWVRAGEAAHLGLNGLGRIRTMMSRELSSIRTMSGFSRKLPAGQPKRRGQIIVQCA